MSPTKGKVSRVQKTEFANKPHRYGNLRAIWDLMVLPTTRQRWHSRLYLSQLRPVLDLATLDGCKAELTQLAWLHTEVI